MRFSSSHGSTTLLAAVLSLSSAAQATHEATQEHPGSGLSLQGKASLNWTANGSIAGNAKLSLVPGAGGQQQYAPEQQQAPQQEEYDDSSDSEEEYPQEGNGRPNIVIVPVPMGGQGGQQGPPGGMMPPPGYESQPQPQPQEDGYMGIPPGSILIQGENPGEVIAIPPEVADRIRSQMGPGEQVPGLAVEGEGQNPEQFMFSQGPQQEGGQRFPAGAFAAEEPGQQQFSPEDFQGEQYPEEQFQGFPAGAYAEEGQEGGAPMFGVGSFAMDPQGQPQFSIERVEDDDACFYNFGEEKQVILESDSFNHGLGCAIYSDQGAIVAKYSQNSESISAAQSKLQALYQENQQLLVEATVVIYYQVQVEAQGTVTQIAVDPESVDQWREMIKGITGRSACEEKTYVDPVEVYVKSGMGPANETVDPEKFIYGAISLMNEGGAEGKTQAFFIDGEIQKQNPRIDDLQLGLGGQDDEDEGYATGEEPYQTKEEYPAEGQYPTQTQPEGAYQSEPQPEGEYQSEQPQPEGAYESESQPPTPYQM
jgi:hypothetical protein